MADDSLAAYELVVKSTRLVLLLLLATLAECASFMASLSLSLFKLKYNRSTTNKRVYEINE